MAVWLIRTGKHGEYEEKFLQNSLGYLTWGRLKHDLSRLKDKGELREILRATYPDAPPGRLSNFTGQIWPFAREMTKGDWLMIPSKKKSAIHVAEIIGDYKFDAGAPDPLYHTRALKWIATDVPRSNFDQDLLYSMGAIMTICKIQRHDAEKRIRAMALSNWKSSQSTATTVSLRDADEESRQPDEAIDLEERGRDQIAQLISRHFQGHALTRLVEAMLKAQGYFTYRSPPGPDKGIDILAAPAPLGFGQPRICVQVKSGDTPVDTPTLNQLIGAMQNVHADQGLLVSWGGFKSSVDKEIPAQFFRVRVWDQKVLIDELLAHYDKLDEDIRAELPLKHIWTVAADDEETD
jgi:restriction system protein